MLSFLAAGDPFQHTWNTWLIEFYGLVEIDLRNYEICRKLGITNAVVTMLFVALLLVAMGAVVGREVRRAQAENRCPRGLAAVVESLVEFIRNEMMRPNLPHHYKSPYFLSFFATIGFFVLVNNLLGLLPQPFGHTATGSFWVNAGLAFGMTYIVGIIGGGFREHGIGFLAHIAPHAPFPIRWGVLWPIEFLGLLVKPFALTIRLTANMTAGHIILAVLIGFLSHSFDGIGTTIAVKLPSALGYAAITGFEVAICFIQAYIFTVLSCVFVGASLSHEH
jgi:F-type H+-transporting ATPase subunit a